MCNMCNYNFRFLLVKLLKCFTWLSKLSESFLVDQIDRLRESCLDSHILQTKQYKRMPALLLFPGLACNDNCPGAQSNSSPSKKTTTYKYSKC